jgi:Cu(I)/Ag(I) efflux system membrane protein CusA/SilA
VPGTRSAFAERVAGGYFVDFEPNRDQLARYGLRVDELQAVVLAAAIGGENVTTTIEGRARFPVNVRYPRELRDDPERLAGAGAGRLRRAGAARAARRPSAR